jgi:predicted nucleotidyltransferase
MSARLAIDRDAVSAFCRRHHITRLALFGSVLRDDFGPESDIDVLVEFQPGHVPGLKFVSIEREFADLVQRRRVDMVTAKFLNPRIRDQVVGSAEPLYVAARSRLRWAHARHGEEGSQQDPRSLARYLQR